MKHYESPTIKISATLYARLLCQSSSTQNNGNSQKDTDSDSDKAVRIIGIIICIIITIIFPVAAAVTVPLIAVNGHKLISH